MKKLLFLGVALLTLAGCASDNTVTKPKLYTFGKVTLTWKDVSPPCLVTSGVTTNGGALLICTDGRVFVNQVLVSK